MQHVVTLPLPTRFMPFKKCCNSWPALRFLGHTIGSTPWSETLHAQTKECEACDVGNNPSPSISRGFIS